MCGFVALIALDGQPVDEAPLRRMMQTIVHRGPDDAGVAIDGGVGLAFRRLSILDLSPQGHQPMDSPDGSASPPFSVSSSWSRPT